MKKALVFLILALLCIKVTAQNPTDFYVDLSKSAGNDSVLVVVSVPFHINIGYEVLEMEIKKKGAAAGVSFQLSSRYPHSVINNMNTYIYTVPFKAVDGVVYEVIIDNSKLCNTGPFKITEKFSSINKHTFSYANPGYKLTSSIRSEKN